MTTKSKSIVTKPDEVTKQLAIKDYEEKIHQLTPRCKSFKLFSIVASCKVACLSIKLILFVFLSR